eukprot:7300881-Prorocentrum_lima.AAC.1
MDKPATDFFWLGLMNSPGMATGVSERKLEEGTLQSPIRDPTTDLPLQDLRMCGIKSVARFDH